MRALQTQTTDMPPPGAKVNGLELALQRAWVDAAARRAKRDSLGALAGPFVPFRLSTRPRVGCQRF